MGKRLIKTSIGCAAMLAMILDAKIAASGVRAGIDLCLYTVIPSLFPFFIITTWLCSGLAGQSWKILRPLEQICGAPEGAGSILLTGFVGGYPVGANTIRNAFERGSLQRKDAVRMLGYCNNAGPAFLFGMASVLFENPWVPCVIWLAHIFSAVLTALVLPGRAKASCKMEAAPQMSMIQALVHSIRIMAQVCGWVIVFRVILSFLHHWFSFFLPVTAQVFVAGMLELSNGCVLLQKISSEGLRFLLITFFANAGGLCVAMQTLSAVGDLGAGMYFQGKALQCVFSLSIAALIQPLLFDASSCYMLPIPAVILLGASGLISIYCVHAGKKVVAFPENIMYNERKNGKVRGFEYAVSEKN